jgi:uncharacterized protein YggU (UPF0235/DUF167 family)
MILHVQVKAGKRREKVELKNGQWIISISAPASEGKANERMVEFLSEILNIPESSIGNYERPYIPFKTLDIQHSKTWF